jgi:hypothetical protein
MSAFAEFHKANSTRQNNSNGEDSFVMALLIFLVGQIYFSFPALNIRNPLIISGKSHIFTAPAALTPEILLKADLFIT